MPKIDVEGQAFEFEEGTPEHIIKRTIQNHFGTKSDRYDPASVKAYTPDESPMKGARIVPFGIDSLSFDAPDALKAATISVGSGIADVIRGVKRGFGYDTQGELIDSDAAMQPLRNEYPITSKVGEVVGQALPFAAAPVGAIQGLGLKMGASAGLGALEGAAISAGRGSERKEIISDGILGGALGTAGEAVTPYIRRAWNKIGEGRPANLTDKAADAVKSAGVDPQSLPQSAIREVRDGFDPAEVARKAEFEKLGIPYTKGDISQKSSVKMDESRLLNTGRSQAGQDLQAFRADQSQRMQDILTRKVDDLGEEADPGELVKDALTSRKGKQKALRNHLYGALDVATDSVKNTELDASAVRRALLDSDTLDDLAITVGDNNISAIETLLTKYGVIDDPDSAERFLAGTTRGRPNQIGSLTMGNAEKLAKALNQITDPDPSKNAALQSIIGPLRKAIREQSDTAAEGLRGADSVVESLSQAKSLHGHIKQEFTDQDIVGKLINTKRDGITPMIESSAVYKQLFTANKNSSTIEKVDRVLSSLEKSGLKGERAIKGLRARVTLDLIDKAFSQAGSRVNGQPVFAAAAYNNALKGFGDEELSRLFRTDKATLVTLRRIGRVAQNTKASNLEATKGSGSVILDAMNKAGLSAALQKVPLGGTIIVNTISEAAKAQGDAKILKRVLNATPDKKEAASYIIKELPHLATALGIAGAVGIDSEATE